MEAKGILTQLAPGQSGIVYQGLGNWREVRCQQVAGEVVTLLLHEKTGEGEIALHEVVAFKTRCDSGLLRLEGSLENAGIGTDSHPAGKLVDFTPTVSAKVVNRRQAFRVESELPARILGTASKATAAQEGYGYKWECVLRDLSVGGTNAALPSPGPAKGAMVMITLPLPTESKPLLIECEVIEVVQADDAEPPLDTMVRLKFKGLSSRVENQLGKHINWVQLEERRHWLPL